MDGNLIFVYEEARKQADEIIVLRLESEMKKMAKVSGKEANKTDKL